MLDSILTIFYERDIRRLIEEINLFKQEEDIWKTEGSVKNSCGNLALHIIGGTNYLFGTKLAQTGYVRNRDEEFIQKDVSKKHLITELESLIPLIKTILSSIDINAAYPMMFDGEMRTNGYVITQLALHLNYHLGQVNYLRRILEK